MRRAAQARGEEEVCRSVVEGLRDEAFGFDGVGLYLAGSTAFLFLGAAKASAPLGAGCTLLVAPLAGPYALPLSTSGSGAPWRR